LQNDALIAALDVQTRLECGSSQKFRLHSDNPQSRVITLCISGAVSNNLIEIQPLASAAEVLTIDGLGVNPDWTKSRFKAKDPWTRSAGPFPVASAGIGRPRENTARAQRPHPQTPQSIFCPFTS
jgi:hypothetical protein